MSDETTKKHPSYGTVQISRVHSSANNEFFGSSITHQDFIALRINQASIQRNLHRDWIHAEENIVEVYMSQTQFAEAITSMNLGSGTPCTIHSVLRKLVEPDKFENKRFEFEKEFDAQVKKVNTDSHKLMAELYARFADSKPLTKKEREEICGQLRMLNQEIECNMPFIQKSFAEQMDRTVLESKGEAEAFIEGKIRSLGLKGMEDLIQIENKENVK
jgi:hypothetical protein